MEKHYQEVVDEIFGSLYRHRTLRTLFDPSSTEWEETTIEKKIEILKQLLETGGMTLEEILSGYKHFYLKELSNKRHVVNSLQDGLTILLNKTLNDNANN